jgi:hypothetical protein
VLEKLAAARLRARVRCAAEAVYVEVVAPEGVAFREEADPSAPSLERAIAIIIVEGAALYVSRPTEPAVEPPPASHLWVGAMGGVLSAVQATGTQVGGAATLRYEPGDFLAWAAALDVTHGVHSREVTGTTASLAGAAELRARVAATTDVALGLGLRAGMVSWAGTADGGRSGLGPWGGAIGTLGVRLPVSPRLRLELQGEVGTVVYGTRATANGVTLAQIGPTWLQVRIGAAFDLAQ